MRGVGRGPGRGTYLHGHVVVDVGFAVGWEHLEQLWEQVGAQPDAPMGDSSVWRPLLQHGQHPTRVPSQLFGAGDKGDVNIFSYPSQYKYLKFV